MSFVERRRFLWALFLGGLVLLAICAVASSTTLARLGFRELAQKSTAIVRARCLSHESVMLGGEIYTETRFEITAEDKGVSPRLIAVRMPGGAWGHLHSRVDGVPNFRVGEDVYLFLWERPGQPCAVLGWTQGTFRIAHDSRSRLDLVTQDSAGVPIFDPLTKEFRAGGVRNLPLPDFQLKLRRALQRSAP
jgi:hypothetical protein